MWQLPAELTAVVRSHLVHGVHVYAPDGTKIGQLVMPEGCANLAFVGEHRNRLFICGSHSVYTIYTAAQGAHIT